MLIGIFSLLAAGLGVLAGRYQRRVLPDQAQQFLARRLEAVQSPLGTQLAPRTLRAARFVLSGRMGLLSRVLNNASFWVFGVIFASVFLSAKAWFFVPLGFGIAYQLAYAGWRLQRMGVKDLRQRAQAFKQARVQQLFSFLNANPSPDSLQLLAHGIQATDKEIRSATYANLPNYLAADPSSKPRVSSLISEGLYDKELSIRQEALKGLALLDRPALQDHAIRLMTDTSPVIRKGALQLHDLLPYADKVKLLTESLRDSNPDVQRAALQIIQQDNPIAQSEWLTKATDANPLVRQTAARALGAYPEPNVALALAVLLSDKEDLVQQAAIQSLAGMNLPQATEALAGRISTEKRPEKLILLARAIGRQKHIEGVAALIGLLANRQEPIRIAASESLVQVGPAALPALIDALASDAGTVRTGAARSLLLLKEPTGLAALAALRDDTEAEVRELSLRAVAELSPDDRLVELLPRLQDANFSVRHVALQELMRLGDVRALPGLAQRHTLLQGEHFTTQLFNTEKRNQELAELLAALRHLAPLQAAQRLGHPDLFCNACRRKPTLQGEADWQFVTCGNCRNPDQIKSGITRVIGTIGQPQPTDLPDALATHILYLPLWDEAARVAMPAQVDTLLVYGNNELDYDWALSAVLQAQQNMFPHPSGRLPIRFDPQPQLSANTERILRELSTEDFS